MIYIQNKIKFLILFSLSMAILYSICFSVRITNEMYDIDKIVQDSNTIPVLILGGGCAGLYASVYCAQANIPCMIIEGAKAGGSLTQSHSVRNWPGIIDKPGAEIMANLRDQSINNNVHIVTEEVIDVNVSQWPRIIKTRNLHDNTIKFYKALTLIIALGTAPNMLGIPGESGINGYWGRGVSNCAVCEGSLYTDKSVAVIGGGDAAITEADYLANIAKEVTIFIRSNAFRGKDIKTRNRILEKPNVRVCFNTEVKEIKGDGKKVTHVIVANNKTGDEKSLLIDGCFLAIGSRPQTDLFFKQLALNKKGLIVLGKHQETSVKGVFAAGDVCDDEFMQASTALGDGCKAALQACRFLKKIDFDITTWNSRCLVKNNASESVISETLIREIDSDIDFEKYVINAKMPVVIDLFSTWCIPCQQMLPIVEKTAQVLHGNISFVKINIQEKKIDVQKKLKRICISEVNSVPAFICVKNGKEIGRFIGTVKQQNFIQNIRSTFNI